MDSRTGEYITAHQANNGIFIWEIRNPLHMRVTQYDQTPFNNQYNIIHLQIRFNHNLRQALGLHKCYMNFQVWTTSWSSSTSCLRSFKIQVNRYLDALGVISVNNVIRSVDHVLYDVWEGTIDVICTHDIKFKIY
ncbi:replication enhancer [West African Asystasia virus 1]|uniref:Replication enhancer n=1 Tax=West African Asystasia virus 1 TaxID=1046573 RepID=G9CM25_9GEMI|nr:replication enhancer [West African Asystasia virus 1]AEI91432.1 replication enhancer [West African Asystasia virus 1]ALQ10786.1 AC3 [West African Asystasia virus 1]ALQ10795.1 AC3 [West African Asystasia virus 1]